MKMSMVMILNYIRIASATTLYFRFFFSQKSSSPRVSCLENYIRKFRGILQLMDSYHIQEQYYNSGIYFSYISIFNGYLLCY